MKTSDLQDNLIEESQISKNDVISFDRDGIVETF